MKARVDWRLIRIDLRSRMESEGLSQTAMARQIGISAPSLSKFMTTRTVLDLDNLVRVVVWLYPNDIPDWIDR